MCHEMICSISTRTSKAFNESTTSFYTTTSRKAELQKKVQYAKNDESYPLSLLEIKYTKQLVGKFLHY